MLSPKRDKELQPFIDELHEKGRIAQWKFDKLYSHSLWHKRQEQVLYDRRYTCENCYRKRGDKDVILQAHHKNYPDYCCPHEIGDEDVECLCKVCHKEYVHRIDVIKTVFPYCFKCKAELHVHFGRYDAKGDLVRDFDGYVLDWRGRRVIDQYKFCPECAKKHGQCKPTERKANNNEVK